MVSLFKLKLLFLLFNFLYLSQANNYIRKELPVKDVFSFEIKIEPGCWYVFLDTINEYFILYQPNDSDDDDYKWPDRLIKQTHSIVEKGQTTLINYNQPIQTKIYTLTIGFENTSFELHNFTTYYTNDHCQDDKVWQTVDRNIRQLSLGVGLNVQNPSHSLIYELHRNNIITERKFSYETGERQYITLGSNDARKQNYVNKFISKIPIEEHTWGLKINRIIINNKKYDFEKFAFINSGLDMMFRSFNVYQVFKSYLQENKKYKDICKETIYLSSVTMECGIALDEINEMIRLNVANEIAFDIPLHKFFVSMNSKKSWMKYVYYDMRNDNKNDNSIQVGKIFLEMFNLVEFDFDKRIIEFYSQNLEFKNEPLGLFKLSNKKKLNIACNILVIMLSVITIGYICITKKYLKALVQQ